MSVAIVEADNALLREQMRKWLMRMTEAEKEVVDLRARVHSLELSRNEHSHQFAHQAERIDTLSDTMVRFDALIEKLNESRGELERACTGGRDEGRREGIADGSA